MLHFTREIKHSLLSMDGITYYAVWVIVQVVLQSSMTRYDFGQTFLTVALVQNLLLYFQTCYF